MPDTYTLTLNNRSAQPDFSFAVYAVCTVRSGLADTSATRSAAPPANVHPVAWLASPVNPGGRVTFRWSLAFSLLYAARGCREGEGWQADGSAAVRDDDGGTNSALLDCADGGYLLRPAPGRYAVRPGYVHLGTTARVPAWTQRDGPSVGLAIAAGPEARPMPAMVTDSGPNLLHVFGVEPEYRIWAGQVAPGTTADLQTVRGHQQVVYGPGATSAEWTLDAANRWRAGPPA